MNDFQIYAILGILFSAILGLLIFVWWMDSPNRYPKYEQVKLFGGPLDGGKVSVEIGRDEYKAVLMEGVDFSRSAVYNRILGRHFTYMGTERNG